MFTKKIENAYKILSVEAYVIYADTFPLDIYERHGLYSLVGAIQRDEMTLEELDSFLVQLGEEEDTIW